MKMLKFNWWLFCISVILLAGGLQFFFLPSWCKRGVDVSFDLDIEKKTYVRVFYIEDGAFTEAQVISLPVYAGTNQVRCVVPVAKLTRLRVDVGSKPGKFTISPIELSGETTITYRWTDSERRNEIGTWTVGSGDHATGVSNHRNPYVIADLSKNPVSGRMQVHWPSVALSLLLCAVFFVKPLRSIGPYVSPVGTDGRVFVYDILRVIAFSTIVISHVVAHDATPGWISTSSACGVSWFVILSGAGLALGRLDIGWWGFLRRRFSVILPTYWVAYVLMAVLLLVARSCMNWGEDPVKWLMTICGVDGFLNRKLPFNYCLIGDWYVGFALMLYVFAIAVVWGCRHHPFCTAISVGLIAMVGWFNHLFLFRNFLFWNPDFFWNPVARLPEFTFGVLFSFYVIRSRKRLLMSAVSAAAVLVVLPLFRTSFFGVSYVCFVGYMALFILICAGSTFFRFADAFRNAVDFLARHSFAAFLVHHQVVWWIIDVCPRKANFSRDAYCILVILATVIFSYLLAWLIAKPAAVVKALVFDGRSVASSAVKSVSKDV